jgi:hypothetical protein
VLELQGKGKEAEQKNLKLIAEMQRAVKAGEVKWGLAWDQSFYPALVARAKNDEASLRHAMHVLKDNEMQAKTDQGDSMGGWYLSYARIQMKLGQSKEAIKTARLALAKRNFYALNIQYFLESFVVGLLRDGSQFKEAEGVLRDSMADRQKTYGDDHVLTHYARADLAEFLIEVKKYAEAKGLLQTAQKAPLADQRVPASQRQRVASALAKIYEAWGKPDQAAQWRAKAYRPSHQVHRRPRCPTASNGRTPALRMSAISDVLAHGFHARVCLVRGP